MPTCDWAGVVKLLLMTTSPHDAEALTALRLMTRKLEAAGLSMHDLAARVSGAHAHESPAGARRERYEHDAHADKPHWPHFAGCDPAEFRRRILILYGKSEGLGYSVETRERAKRFIQDNYHRYRTYGSDWHGFTEAQAKWFDDLWTRYGNSPSR